MRDAIERRDVGDLEHLHQLVELFTSLLDLLVTTVDDDGHAGDAGLLGVTDGDRVDVERSSPQERNDAVEDAGVIFDQDTQDVPLLHAGLLFVPLLVQHFRVCRAWRHDWPHVRLGLDHEVDQDRSPDRSGSIDGRANFRIGAHRDSRDSVRLGQPLEAGGADADLGIVLGVEEVLPLPHHAKVTVVDHGDVDIEVFLDSGRQLIARHLEAAVADDRPDLEIGTPDFGADR